MKPPAAKVSKTKLNTNIFASFFKKIIYLFS